MTKEFVKDLITDMMVMGAPKEELDRAIEYSKYVIKAEEARISLGIPELTRKYLTFELKDDKED